MDIEAKTRELNELMGGVVDLGASEKCNVCGETYVKTLPGLNVCGPCQVAMAIVMNWKVVLWHRWGVWK